MSTVKSFDEIMGAIGDPALAKILAFIQTNSIVDVAQFVALLPTMKGEIDESNIPNVSILVAALGVYVWTMADTECNDKMPKDVLAKDIWETVYMQLGELRNSKP